MMQNDLLAGAGQVDITPPLGTRINGDFMTHFATYIHDKLHAKAVVLKDSNRTIIFVVVDICHMSQDIISQVKSVITTQKKIPSDNILISSTHTHAAGAVEEGHMSSLDLAYREQLPGRIVQSVQKAINRLQPSKVTYGAIDVPDHVLCRRYYMTDDYISRNPVSGEVDEIKTNPFGQEDFIIRPVSPPDPQLNYLAIKGLNNKWICVLGNYSLHYVGDWENGTISSDYFGTFSKYLNRELNANDRFVGIMSNGTSGDVNLWDFQQEKDYPTEHFEKSKQVGKELAIKVSKSIKNSNQWERHPVINIETESLSLKRRKATQEELFQAQKIVRDSDFESMGYTDEDLRKSYAREQLLLNEYSDTTTCPLQVIRIGDLLINGLPGEFFAETGLWIKSQSPAKFSFSIGLANDYIGYVPPPDQFELGGYETWRCRGSCMEIGAEPQIRRKIVAMLNKV